jgi:hypothetical protein
MVWFRPTFFRLICPLRKVNITPSATRKFVRLVLFVVVSFVHHFGPFVTRRSLIARLEAYHVNMNPKGLFIRVKHTLCRGLLRPSLFVCAVSTCFVCDVPCPVQSPSVRV